MAIVFPAICRNVTSGALRQAKQHGATTACKGLFSREGVDRLALRVDAYFDHNEPAGAYMDTLERTKQQFEENTEAVSASARKLVEVAVESNKQIAGVTGKFREGTERLGVAIDKLTKVAGRGDFAQLVKQTESLVDSLERLAALEEKGLLDKVIKAMSH
jgi:soluble cytochrome b562